MPTPSNYAGSAERGDTYQSISTYIPDPTADARITLFRARRAGRVLGARWIPDGSLASGTANHYNVAIHNGGTFAAGTATTVICAAVGGTNAGGTAPGWTASTDVDLPVTGTPTFVAGEAIVLSYDETGTVAPSGRIQLDYRYNV